MQLNAGVYGTIFSHLWLDEVWQGRIAGSFAQFFHYNAQIVSTQNHNIYSVQAWTFKEAIFIETNSSSCQYIHISGGERQILIEGAIIIHDGT